MKKVNKKISAENTTKKNYFNLNFQRKFRNVTGGLLLALGVIGAGTSCQKEEDDPINFIKPKPPVTNPTTNDTIIRTDQDTTIVPDGRTLYYNFEKYEHLLVNENGTYAAYPDEATTFHSFLTDSVAADTTIVQIVLRAIDSTVYSGLSHMTLPHLATSYEYLFARPELSSKIRCEGPLLLDTGRNAMQTIDRFREFGFDVSMYDMDAKSR